MARPPSSSSFGEDFAGRIPRRLRRQIVAQWRRQHPGSTGLAQSILHELISQYIRDGAADGWTAGRFYALLAAAITLNWGRCSASTLRKYAAMMLCSGCFVAERLYGGARGAILRVHLSEEIIAFNGGVGLRDRQRRRRALDAARKRRTRARQAADDASPKSRASARRGPDISATQIDQIDQELQILSEKLSSDKNVRATQSTDGEAASEPPPAQPAKRGVQKADPPTPTAAPQGPEICHTKTPLGCDPGPSPAAAAPPTVGGQVGFASPEALEEHLYSFVASRPLSELQRLREQVGPAIYQALVATHNHGVQGLKGSHVDAVRHACRQVARAHAPKPRTQRQRAERFRLRIDRRAGSASRRELDEAVVAMLGPVAARQINPGHLLTFNLSVPQAEAALGRVQRHLKIGSQGPTALRTPGALAAYTITTFRRQDRGTDAPPKRAVRAAR